MSDHIIVRPFTGADASQVEELFVRVNRLLAPASLKSAFEEYITASIGEEIGRISAYYDDRKGSFWMATAGAHIVGMFGLEPAGQKAMELRRMYVDPDWRRQGIAGKMLEFAEIHCRARNMHQLDLSTSEIQSQALAFYRKSGYGLVREEVTETASNKTIGGGIRRYHFQKIL